MDAACCSDEETEGRVVGTSPFGDPVLQQTAYSMSSMPKKSCRSFQVCLGMVVRMGERCLSATRKGCDGVSGTYDIANNGKPVVGDWSLTPPLFHPMRLPVILAMCHAIVFKCDGTVLKWNGATRIEEFRNAVYLHGRNFKTLVTTGYSPECVVAFVESSWHTSRCFEPIVHRSGSSGYSPSAAAWAQREYSEMFQMSDLNRLCPNDTKETGGQCGGSQSRKHFDQTTYDEDLRSTKLFSIRRWSSRLAVPPYLVSIVQFNLTQPKTLGEQELRRVNHKSIDDAFDCYRLSKFPT
ncbi:hypothetical protein EV360DRAFT_72716 [Lentinula raphanica]|nr:hypothetical protein EV360DRAFT_72716 [Lentinula raphanica]